MINRELIRLKMVQLTYAYFQRGSSNVDAAEKELLLSLSQAYNLYNHLLLLMVELHRMAERTFEMRQTRAQRLGERFDASRKFLDNRFMKQLEANKQLVAYRDEQRTNWFDNEEFVRSLYNHIEQSEYYIAYMNNCVSSYEEDREVWRLIYRHLICNNDELYAILEDTNLYWNDDKIVVDTFVLKTINRFQPDTTPDMPLLPEYRDEADRRYAIALLHRTLENSDYYYSLIAATTRKWDVERVALMDRVILHIALAEILSFPEIPVVVSISEYVDIAKAYSTPKSSKYINATLDNIAKQLQKENKLIKN